MERAHIQRLMGGSILKMVIAIAAVTISVSSHAAASASTEQDDVELCVLVSRIAETAMRARQTGMALTEFMDLGSGSGLWRSITLEAYEAPRWPVEEFRQREIDTFRDRWALNCYRHSEN